MKTRVLTILDSDGDSMVQFLPFEVTMTSEQYENQEHFTAIKEYLDDMDAVLVGWFERDDPEARFFTDLVWEDPTELSID